jgi:hypothetical protein
MVPSWKDFELNELKKSGAIITEKHSKSDPKKYPTIMAAARMVPAAAEAYGRLATLAPSFKVCSHFRDKVLQLLCYLYISGWLIYCIIIRAGYCGTS